MTVNELIHLSARLCGGIAKGQTLDPQDIQDALRMLNGMLAEWSTGKLNVSMVSHDTFTATGGKASYTIGDSASYDIHTQRPIVVLGGTCTSNGVDYPIEPISWDEYDAITLKTVQGIPSQVYYDGMKPMGTVYLYPVPVQAYQITLDEKKPLGSFTSTATVLTISEEIESAIVNNFALRICPLFSVSATVEMVNNAKTSYNSIKTQPIPTANTNPISDGGVDSSLASYYSGFQN